MDQEELLIENNVVMHAVLEELRSIKTLLAKNEIEVDTCSPSEALAMLGLNNERYLTYYNRQGLLNRRKGGQGFLYFKEECRSLAEKFKSKVLIVPPVKAIYDK